jgi:two-component system, cell cycle sensor histidine kinase and response regulator CckA
MKPDEKKTNAELIAELQQLRQQIGQSQLSDDPGNDTLYRSLVENTPEIIMRLDRELRHVYVNPAVCAISNHPPEAFPGKTQQELGIEKPLRSFCEEHVNTVFQAGQPLERELEWQCRGKLVHFEWRIIPEADTRGDINTVLCVGRDISAQRESEKNYRMLFNGMLDAFALHELICDDAGKPCDYRFLEINPAFEQMTGMRAADVVGKTVKEIMPQIEDYWIDTYGNVTLTGKPARIENYSKELNKWYEVVAFCPRLMQFAVIFQDVTERKEMVQAIQESEERFRQLAENVEAVFWIGSPDWQQIFYLSPAYEQVWGRTRESLYAEPLSWIDTVFEEDRAKVIADIEDKVANRIPKADFPEYRIHRPDGSMRWIQARAYPILDAEGNIYRIAGIATDITEKKEANREREQLEAQMQHAQKLESLGVLAGGIAHDFNNLLMGILGNADLALNDVPDSSPIRASLDDIINASRKAADLCRQMLAYSGKGQFIVEELNVNEVVQEIGHLLSVSVSKKAVLQYALADAVPAVRADSSQLRQVIMNLITNASEAIGDIDGVIAVTTSVQYCSESFLNATYINEGQAPGNYVCLEIRDTGCGMDETTVRNIFDPFYTTKFTGRGLGLAAVLGIIRGHRGALSVDSSPGKGTDFKIFLPALETPAPPVQPKTNNGDDWYPTGTILLVDDETTVLQVGQRMLKKVGFSVESAENGQDAVELFQKQHENLTAVVLDLAMPKMNGIETFHAMQKINANVPVLLSSGYDESEVLQQYDTSGLAGFIQKPYRINDLKAILKAVLQNA